MAQANRSIEIGTGLFVLLGFAALGFLTTQLPGSGLQLRAARRVYTVIAKFDDIGGLKVGRAGDDGGRAGRAGRRDQLRHSVYKAAVTLSIDRRYDKIPDDSDAAIQTSGLLGANYIALIARRFGHVSAGRQRMQFTQSAIVLENLINKLFANFAAAARIRATDKQGSPEQACEMRRIMRQLMIEDDERH